MIVFFRTVPKYKFMKYRHLAFAATVAIMIASVIALLAKGLDYGIDFKGGVLIEARWTKPFDMAEVRGKLNDLDVGEVALQNLDNPNDLLIRVEQPEGGQAGALRVISQIRATLPPDVEYRNVEMVGPQVSGELLRGALIAAALAVLGIAGYVAFRFEWQFGVSALIATGHDVFCTFGLFALLDLEFNLTAVAAILTIAGYSVNDTVVVFDRVRENLRKYKKIPLIELFDLSVNETLSRTILTSGTTLIAILPLLFFGGIAIHDFALAITFGILIGTYSSVFVACGILLYMPPIGKARAVAEETEDGAKA
ncbi:MAG: protein translocase subunit SecF [Alphaproteobacteria bacterium]|nr:protein translocase subunit SecF [Alphaproteobacteria bacterium]